ncbi:hypothetical protein HPB51_014931 [Rhipicephalus microplus]|uniref:Globin domain-containing protein n=1 Tax=Rhipicephalus microplus TaxID=6941 RepID=A0A9J6E1A3_RHIMP|nr:hypothetical protein HPB51_014931 [Rhipicephalus microplus]
MATVKKVTTSPFQCTSGSRNAALDFVGDGTPDVSALSRVRRLFQEKGDLLDLFEKFQALRTKESQRESMELAQHASVVMTTLDEGINALDNLDYFMDYLHNTGRLHFKIKGFKKEYFWHIENPFLAAVSETLGDRYTENIENIYKITIRFILETLVEGFEMAEKEAAA